MEFDKSKAEYCKTIPAIMVYQALREAGYSGAQSAIYSLKGKKIDDNLPYKEVKVLSWRRNETEPSMCIGSIPGRNGAINGFHDFGNCSKPTGSVVSMVMEIANKSYGEALDWLAERFAKEKFDTTIKPFKEAVERQRKIKEATPSNHILLGNYPIDKAEDNLNCFLVAASNKGVSESVLKQIIYQHKKLLSWIDERLSSPSCTAVDEEGNIPFMSQVEDVVREVCVLIPKYESPNEYYPVVELFFRMREESDMEKQYDMLVEKTTSLDLNRGVGRRPTSASGERRIRNTSGANATYTFIPQQGKPAKKLALFEGVFDFLSFLKSLWDEGVTMHDADYDYIVLNSTSNVRRLVDLKKQYASYHCFFDNDEAGRKCQQEFESYINDKTRIKDFYELYKANNMNDLGELYEKTHQINLHKRFVKKI